MPWSNFAKEICLIVSGIAHPAQAKAPNGARTSAPRPRGALETSNVLEVLSFEFTNSAWLK